MRSLELRVPPDVVAVVVIGLMSLLARVGVALPLAPVPRYLLGAALVLAGAVIVVRARGALARHHTAWQPGEPSRAAVLVTDGIYGLTRNPMYLGTWVFVLGVGIMFGSCLSAVGSLLYTVYVDRFQIAPEERALAVRFGDAFASYRRAVRRWV